MLCRYQLNHFKKHLKLVVFGQVILRNCVGCILQPLFALKSKNKIANFINQRKIILIKIFLARIAGC